MLTGYLLEYTVETSCQLPKGIQQQVKLITGCKSLIGTSLNPETQDFSPFSGTSE